MLFRGLNNRIYHHIYNELSVITVEIFRKLNSQLFKATDNWDTGEKIIFLYICTKMKHHILNINEMLFEYTYIIIYSWPSSYLTFDYTNKNSINQFNTY